MVTVWSIGYGCVGDLWGHLRGAGVQRLVDVRANAWSKRPQWCGPELASACRERGIAYDWLGRLGNPFRGGRTRAEWEIARERFEAHLDHPERHQALLELVGLARATPTVVMCQCRDHDRCHRGVVLDRLADHLQVVRLGEVDAPSRQLTLWGPR